MTTLSWTRISELYVTFPVSPTNAAGSPVTINGVDCALLPYRAKGPDASTVWVAATWDAVEQKATVLVCGPDVDIVPADALQLTDAPGGGDLWARVVDDPETNAAFVSRIDLLA